MAGFTVRADGDRVVECDYASQRIPILASPARRNQSPRIAKAHTSCWLSVVESERDRFKPVADGTDEEARDGCGRRSLHDELAECRESETAFEPVELVWTDVPGPCSARVGSGGDVAVGVPSLFGANHEPKPLDRPHGVPQQIAPRFEKPMFLREQTVEMQHAQRRQNGFEQDRAKLNDRAPSELTREKTEIRGFVANAHATEKSPLKRMLRQHRRQRAEPLITVRREQSLLPRQIEPSELQIDELASGIASFGISKVNPERRRRSLLNQRTTFSLSRLGGPEAINWSPANK